MASQKTINILDNRFGDLAYFVEKTKVYESIYNGDKWEARESPCGMFLGKQLGDLKKMSSKPVKDIVADSDGNLLIFSKGIDSDSDLYGDDSYIFKLNEIEKDNKYRLSTGNVMGFICVNGLQINIRSRFAQNDENDFFLQHMLRKVLHLNLFDWKLDKSEHPIFDLTAILFPHYLKSAWRKGVFKKYRTYQHNDANIRGVIDVNRHIQKNIPFMGKVAYNTREHSVDNDVTQLVRHTIEFLRHHSSFNGILACDNDTKQAVMDICQATPTFNQKERQMIINKNIRPVSHPYFHEYAQLQNVCRMILMHDRLSYGKENNGKQEIYGVLFDGAWLWEEYIAIVLKERFDHYTSKNSDFKLFKQGIKIVPDYISRDGKSVADAKYIPLDRYKFADRDRNMEIYYKTIVYMHRFGTKEGYLFYPVAVESENEVREDLEIIDTDSTIHQIGLKIPMVNGNFSDFKDKMKDAEYDFIMSVNKF